MIHEGALAVAAEKTTAANTNLRNFFSFLSNDRMRFPAKPAESIRKHVKKRANKSNGNVYRYDEVTCRKDSTMRTNNAVPIIATWAFTLRFQKITLRIRSAANTGFFNPKVVKKPGVLSKFNQKLIQMDTKWSQNLSKV